MSRLRRKPIRGAEAGARRLCGLAVLVVTILFSGCARRGVSAHHDGNMRGAEREIPDMTGRLVRIPRHPLHVLSLCTAATDVMLAVGATNRLAAIDEYSRIVPGTDGIAVVGKGSALSKEQVIARGIDLAFAWWYQDDAVQLLADLGVPTVRIRSGRAAEVPGMIRLVGDCLGSGDAAERVAAAVDEYLARQPAPALPPRAPCVYLELYGPFKTSGAGTYINDVLTLAGASNAAASATGSVLLSAEHLIRANPDVILFIRDQSSASAIAARAGLDGTAAVRRGRVCPLDRYWLVAGPGLPRAVEHIRAIIRDETMEGEPHGVLPDHL